MNLSNKLSIMIVFSTIQYISDIYQYPCNCYFGNITLYLHHILSGYIYFGWLLNPLYHGIFLVTMLIHWKLNNNMCIITQLTNKICYPNIQEYKYFNDFINQLQLHELINNIGYYIIYILLLMDLYLYIC